MAAARRVMIIEDSAATAIAVADALEEAGYEVAICSSCHEALKSLNHVLPDCVVLDITLRDGASHVVARELCRLAVPFVIHTGWARPRNLPEELSGARWLEKPTAFDELVAAVTAVLRLLRARVAS